jgi:hypothetical protein
MKFKKKPVVVEAVKYLGKGYFENHETTDWMWKALESGTARPTNGTDPFVLKTLEGEMVVSPGDWIIQGVNGEIYPCKPDIFEATYLPVNHPKPLEDDVIYISIRSEKICKDVVLTVDQIEAERYPEKNLWLHVKEVYDSLETISKNH